MGVVTIEDIYYTYDDYATWEGDWELIEGKPFAMAPAPLKIHQRIAAEIIYQLVDKVDICHECEVLGGIDYKVCEDTLLRPDVVLTCNDDSEHYLTRAPRIVVEIVSRSSARRDEHFKFSIYESEKVPYYILIYPEDLKAKLYRLKEGKYEKEGDFFKEAYRFEEIGCNVTLDFERVFRRFRR